jgi:hypothetical protein
MAWLSFAVNRGEGAGIRRRAWLARGEKSQLLVTPSVITYPLLKRLSPPVIGDSTYT